MKQLLGLLSPLLFVALAACSLARPPVEPLALQKDRWGCEMPPQVVALTKQGINLEGLHLGDVALGKIDYQSDPDMRVLVEKHSLNSIVGQYLLCNAMERGEIDKNNHTQVDYLRRFLHFMGSGPNPDQIRAWPKENLFRKSSKEESSARLGARLEIDRVTITPPEGTIGLHFNVFLKNSGDTSALGTRHNYAIAFGPRWLTAEEENKYMDQILEQTGAPDQNSTDEIAPMETGIYFTVPENPSGWPMTKDQYISTQTGSNTLYLLMVVKYIDSSSRKVFVIEQCNFMYKTAAHVCFGRNRTYASTP